MSPLRVLPFLLFVFLFLPSGPAGALTCQKDIECDDTNNCTSDWCFSGTCMHMVSCYGAEAPASPPSEGPVDPAALAACLAVCKDEPCWAASCTNKGECMKLATCYSASAEPEPNQVKPIPLSPCLFNCNDGNPCTKDSCLGNQCLHKNICIIFPFPKKCVADADCDDGKYCDGKETCQNGACLSSQAVTCPPLVDDPCKVNACNESAKSCASSPKPAGTACDDGNSCTQADQCQSGHCSGAPIANCLSPPGGQCPADCGDGDACTDDSCDPNTKNCVHAYNAKPGCCLNDADCSVDPPCVAAKCVAHACAVTQNPDACPSENPPGNSPGTPQGTPDLKGPPSKDACGTVPLDDHNPCTDDQCNPSTKVVTHKPITGCASQPMAVPLHLCVAPQREAVNAATGERTPLREPCPFQDPFQIIEVDEEAAARVVEAYWKDGSAENLARLQSLSTSLLQLVVDGGTTRSLYSLKPPSAAEKMLEFENVSDGDRQEIRQNVLSRKYRIEKTGLIGPVKDQGILFGDSPTFLLLNIGSSPQQGGFGCSLKTKAPQ